MWFFALGGCVIDEPSVFEHDDTNPHDSSDTTTTYDTSDTSDTGGDTGEVTDTTPETHPCAERTVGWRYIPTSDAAEHGFEGLWSYVNAPANPACIVPTVLVMTPYDAALTVDIWMDDPEQPLFSSLDYAFVMTDWRGTGGSDGSYWGSPTNGEDGVEVVDWIAQQPWSNGLVGTYGASALGEIQYQMALLEDGAHGRLAAAVPIFHEMMYRYGHAYPGGVFREDYANLLGLAGWDTLASAYKAHPTHDWLWQWAESTAFRDPAAIDVPMLVVGGWFDSDDMESTFATLVDESLPDVQLDHRLFMGPWVHHATVTEMAAATVLTEPELAFIDTTYEIQKAALAFFDHHLRGLDTTVGDGKAVQYVPWGATAWSSSDVWPPAASESLTFSLTPEGGLEPAPPTDEGSVMLTVDPATPSPSLGGMLMDFDIVWWCAAGSEWSDHCDPSDVGSLSYLHGPTDQAPLFDWAAVGLGDPQLFQTGVLSGDLVIEGSIRLDVSVSTDRVDADVTARIVDIQTDGTMMLVGDCAGRLRFRNGFDPGDVAWAEPGTIYELALNIDTPIATTIAAGHRLGVILDGSDYPRFAINPHTGDDFIEDASAPLVATTTIHMGGAHDTRLVIEGHVR